MAFERIILNIIPDGEMPVFHASQFDAGRPIIIDLYNGDDAYTPAAGVTFELHCRKVDDNIVTLDTYEVDGNTITFASTEQLCACSGDNLCEVAIMLDDLLMGTLNFILHVERDPLAGGLTSETSIYNLTEQIDDIISGEGYVKDTDLEVLQSDWNETDVSSPAYIKNKPGPALVDQADWTETDPLKQSYIKHKPDLMVVKSATGNPCTFDTDLADNIVSLTADIVAKQDLHGYDHPWAGGAGKNLLEVSMTDGEVSGVTYTKNADGSIRCVGTITGASAKFISSTASINALKTGVPYVLTGGDEVSASGIRVVSSIQNADGSVARWLDVTKASGHTFTLEEGQTLTSVYLRGATTGTAVNVTIRPMIRLATETDATFAPYENICPISGYTEANITANGNTYTVNFGQTVYGGVLDVTRGKLKPCIEYPSYNGETLSGRWLSSEATYIEGTTPPTGSQVVSLDDYGSDIDLTPVQISALVGTNNITSDLGGDVNVRYVSGELAGQIIDICKMVIAEQGE